ncbi:MAG: hypothetical protein ABIS23_07570 [Sphingomicrobium sp.]
MHKILLAAAAAAAALFASAATAAPPALTLLIHVEGLSSALLDRYRGGFSGGLARISGGTALTIAAGSTPIFADSHSLARPLKAKRPGSRMLVVAGSNASLAALADSGADQRWLFVGTAFQQQTAGPPPPVAAAANVAIARAITSAQRPLVAPPSCAAPPLSPSARRFERAANDAASYRASPQMDGGTLAFAAAIVRDLGYGATSRNADVAVIGLGATAAVASAHGDASQDLCLSLLSLDRDLGDYFAFLDRSKVDYAVVLAGSGSGPAPLLFWRNGWTPATIAGPVSASDLVPTVAAMLGAPIATAGEGSCLENVPGVVCPTR